MTQKDVYIVAATRTPVGKAPRGVFKSTRPDDLLAHAIKSVIEQTPEFDLNDIADVIVGCAMPEAEQGMNVARIGLLLAGLPHGVPGMTINRFCSSGLQAVAMAADRIRSGEADVMMAAGTESMSMVPMMGHHPRFNPSIYDNEHIGIAYGMGITAENVAKQWEISRSEQDEFATQSHAKALAAQERGDFTDEIIPITVKVRSPAESGISPSVTSHLVEHDQGPRAETSVETLSALRPVFAAKGSVTAGNSSQMSDGAAAILLASEEAIKRYHFTPLAKFRAFSVAGVPPEIMGIGPIAAIPKALTLAGLPLSQMDWIELNEAFAAQALAVIKDVNLDPNTVNPLGGAIALGHPLGATGAVRTATLVHGLKRTGQKYGMVTMCIGTGMGAAGIFEAV